MINLFDPSRLTRVLAMGAHSDDIEIGCGGTLLRLIEENPRLHVDWVVFCGADERRRAEAVASAERFLAGAASKRIVTGTFRDAFLPFEGSAVKEFCETLKETRPDAVFTHFRDDRHQDHRLLSDLAWNTFRSHLIFEYEIPKYDGDLQQPNCFAALSEDVCCRKIDALMQGFATQSTRHWFTPDTFWALLRLRGVECASPTRFAEAFHCRKILI